MIHCPRCGGDTTVRNIASRGDSRVADALQVVSRTRTCKACGSSQHTTEIRTAELGELRRQSYLWRLHGDRGVTRQQIKV